MSETSGKNAIELAKEGITAIGSVVKTAKLYPNKSRRLNDRIQPLNDFLSSVNSAKGGADRNISLLTFLIKEVHTFLARFTDSQYLLKSWNANIDLERFHDLTQQVYEFSQTFAVAGGKFDPQAIALEDAQDKKDDDLHHKKVLEGLNPDNAVSVRAGLEGLEAKVVDPLPSSKPKIDEIRTKIHQIETDFENYQDYLIEDLDLASLECDRTQVNKIGEGKFGIVFKGQLLGEEVAVKYLREAVFSAEKQVAIRKEIAKLQLLKHENIVRYFGAQTKTTPYFFVLEKQFCSLYSALYASDENRKLDLGKTNYRRKLEILIDCGRAVEYLHSVNVVYRNIKSTNILVTSAGRAKISDFSYAMNKQDLNFSLSGGSVRASITGSGAVLSAQKVFPAYLAPEIILNANKDPIGYNIHTDAYAFGILINEVLTHTPPFPGLTFRNIMSKLQKSDNNRPLLKCVVFGTSKFNRASLVNKSHESPSFTHITLILERILQVVDDLTAVSVEISDKSPIPSYDETSLSKSVSFTARKSFYQKGVSDNNSSLYEMGNDPNDLSMSRDAGDYSPVKTNKIATIIETYEKGFTTATERSFDRSFERSADFGDANSHPAVFVKIYDKFEKSMDKPNDAMDKSRSIDRTRSQDRMSLSKSGSVERRSLYGVFEPTLEVDSVGSADRSDIVSINPSSADQNKAATSEVTKETAALDLTAIGIAMEHSVSGDSKITDPSLMISKSTDSAAVVLTSPGGSTNVASGTRSFLEVNHSRTFDSYDSNAPPAVTVVKSTSQNAFDIGTEGLKATRTNDSMDYIGAQSTESVNDDDPDYAHSKYIAQLFYDAGSCGKKESQAKLEELAAQNDLLALGFLMGMLCYGSGMSKDVKKANEIAKRIYSLIIQRADDENDSSRKFYQYIAGLCYEQGVGAEKNDILAVKYYQLSADQGYAAALSNLGYCYKHGQGVKEDRYEAVRLYGLGADQNHATSLNNLGYCYQHGYGVQKDLQEAVRLYKRSADQGHSTAQNNLGYCYQYGQGCDKNLAEAVRLYELSAGQGCSFGQNSLGHCYKRGHGVPKDYAKAVYYYRLSAEQGHATAQNNLGYCYQYGQGADVNYAEAVRWYKLSVEQGQASAENNLGFCYQCGIGVKKDLSEAVRLYKSSSEKGYAVAMYNLGLCYLNGMGVPNDPDKAVQLIRSSAEQGHTAGQVKLAMCYEEGVGVAKDTREAIRWYVMAARRGDETAMKALKRIHG